MKIINAQESGELLRVTPTAMTVGKFEALHLGHIHLLEATMEYAKANGLVSAMLSFVPHPAQVLSGDRGYKPLFSQKERAFLLEGCGIDYWIPHPFDRDFARLSPRDFCRLLRMQFGCKALIVGEGFRFGHNRSGVPGMELGLKIITISHLGDGEKISTSKIRQHLANERVAEAAALLGRPFIIMGTVQKGRQLGRTIGFPTANIHPADDKFLPPDGVYATNVIVGGLKKIGVTSIGTNPTVSAGESLRKVETHIFGFDADIYGEDIIVELHKFLRPERTFGGIEELRQQIVADAEEAIRIL